MGCIEAGCGVHRSRVWGSKEQGVDQRDIQNGRVFVDRASVWSKFCLFLFSYDTVTNNRKDTRIGAGSATGGAGQIWPCHETETGPAEASYIAGSGLEGQDKAGVRKAAETVASCSCCLQTNEQRVKCQA